MNCGGLNKWCRTWCKCELDWTRPWRCTFCQRHHEPGLDACPTCDPGGAPRDEVPGWLRGLVLKRDERRCKSCQGIDDLQVDHIVPCAVGGRADEWNLQVLCRPCNNDKGGDWYPGCIWEKVRTDLCDYYFLIAPRWFRQPDLDNFLWERNAYQRTGTWTPLIHKIFAPPRGVVTKRRPALSMLFDFEVDELLSCYENWPPAVAGQP